MTRGRLPRGLLLVACLGLGAVGCDKTGPTASGDPGSGETPAPAEVPAVVAAPDPAPEQEAPSAAADPEPPAEPDVDAEPVAEMPVAAAPEIRDRNVLILGSSLAKTAFGSFLETTLDEHEHVACHRYAKSATGLSRPDFFDWTATAKKQIAKHDPDAIVVVMGGNDGQDLRVIGSKKRVEWGSEGWAGGYRERVDAFVALLAGDDRDVLWLEVPRTNTVKLERKLSTIRQIHREGVEAHPRGTFIELTPLIEGKGGELLREVKVGGRYKTLRGDDGVHFTLGGSRYLSDAVAPRIYEALGVAGASAG